MKTGPPSSVTIDVPSSDTNGQRGHMPDFDAIVIGSGFGGAITACRLAENGYKVVVLERGRR